MSKLIINADDFGLNGNVNQAIMSAMDMGICLDTTLLVNSEASSDAAELAIKKGRKQNVGIHLNLTSGIPVSKDILKESRFCNPEGRFHLKRDKLLISLTNSEARAVHNELTQQIRLCRSFGIPISHADSHKHIHEEPAILKIVLEVMKAERIQYIRLLKNLGNSSIINSVYRNACNAYFKYRKIAAANYFSSTYDFRDSMGRLEQEATAELMIHPGKVEDGQIIDDYSGENLSVELPKLLESNLLTSYDKVKVTKAA